MIIFYERKWIVPLAEKVKYSYSTTFRATPVDQRNLQNMFLGIKFVFEYWICFQDAFFHALECFILAQKLRAKVEDLQDKNTRLEIERDNLAYDLEETTVK